MSSLPSSPSISPSINPGTLLVIRMLDLSLALALALALLSLHLSLDTLGLLLLSPDPLDQSPDLLLHLLLELFLEQLLELLLELSSETTDLSRLSRSRMLCTNRPSLANPASLASLASPANPAKLANLANQARCLATLAMDRALNRLRIPTILLLQLEPLRLALLLDTW